MKYFVWYQTQSFDPKRMATMNTIEDVRAFIADWKTKTKDLVFTVVRGEEVKL